MPRSGKGGKRQGTPGTAYKNRSDLAADRAPAQPVRAPSGQTYGDRGAQEAAQRQVPLPDLASQLQALPGLTDPSARPDEPLTAGMPFGPGPGPINPPVDRSGTGILRRLVAENPDPELFALLELAERSQGGIVSRPPVRRIVAEDEWNWRDRLAERDADFGLEAANQPPLPGEKRMDRVTKDDIEAKWTARDNAAERGADFAIEARNQGPLP